MHKLLALFFLMIAVFSFMPMFCFAEEDSLSFATYYPAPYGNYREMRAMRMAIGDNYIKNSEYAWETGATNLINASADLVVEGDVGIGTSSPEAKLEVVGQVKITGGSPGDNKVLTSDANGLASWQPAGGGVGTIAQMKAIQTRIITGFSAFVGGNGTQITPLNIVITPKKAGNAMVLEWHVNGEMEGDAVYIVQRNGSLLADTTDSSNNTWAGVIAQSAFEYSSTPETSIVRITDFNTLAIETTYSLHIRSSYSTTKTLYLNRSVCGAPEGHDNCEATLSTGTAMEIVQ